MKSKIFLLLLFGSIQLHASDTLRVNLLQADSIFLATNFQVLANILQVQAQQAQIIQAKLYPNPIFSAEWNAYDPQNNKALHIGRSGEKALELDQLLLLGGKRQAQVDLAKTNVELAQLTLQDLTRQLKFELRKSYFAIGRQLYLIEKYTRQLALLESLINAYAEQVKKGNIALKDLVRLKSEYLDLINQRAQLYQEHFTEQANIQTILQTKQYVLPDTSVQSYTHYIKQFDDEFLTNLAFSVRPDFLMANQRLNYAQQTTHYQRTQAKPDLTLTAKYDQNGGAFTNQINVGVSLPLPVWNRNQGNIQTAIIGEKIAATQMEGMRMGIAAEIANGNRAYRQALTQYNKVLEVFGGDYEDILVGMTANFKRGNVNLVEFLDYFQSYNDALNTVSEARQHLGYTAEYLNFLTANELFQ